ncbi:helix-turn-helix transcriptional regulator [Anaerosporobacter faecicola]|uniref:helix-turn-helix transcriptional regulator n=1 Tax=Anaerosporobacter faecicola TaxID=2718714 RepID=UPI001439F9C1|nr:AraC family transcriptional regulator [Anaerosporobacter faecicola]
MQYYAVMKAAVMYIELHIEQPKVDINDFEQALGFSYAHIRDIFQKATGYPLVRYVQIRKIMNSMFDLLYTRDRVLDIAVKYGFMNHETYTRTFRRITGITPMEYRKLRPHTSVEELYDGVYGINLQNVKGSTTIGKANGNRQGIETVLFGIPKIEHGEQGLTPYPMCLKSVSNYLGEDVDYPFIMAASGAAFRLTWDISCWNMGNVDVSNTFDEEEYVYQVGAKALGRKLEKLERTQKTTKEEFKQFIKSHIDRGFPCIALGIIGPPEAGIITGYQKDGDILMGWNFYQEDPIFGGDVQLAENGYYICDNWWENTDTKAVFCMGEKNEKPICTKEILQNAVKILDGHQYGSYKKGLFAYDGWADALMNEKEFQDTSNLSLMVEKLYTHDDAIICLLDGRRAASNYFKQLASTETEHHKEFIELSQIFHNTYKIVEQIAEVLGGGSNQKNLIQKFMEYDNRRRIISLIQKAKHSDEKALKILKTVTL